MAHAVVRVDYDNNRVLVKDNSKVSSSQIAEAEKEQSKSDAVGEEAKVEKEEGEWFQADVILGADGVKSVTRRDMLRLEGEEDHSESLRSRSLANSVIDNLLSVEDTGQAAYRVLLTRDEMKHDPELLALIDGKTTHRWIGHRRHIIVS